MQVRNQANLLAARGVAIREFPLNSGYGEADYLLFVDSMALGVIEAMFGAFACIGLGLVAIGIFSVMAYSVSLQTQEIGIRMALGARLAIVLKMVFRNGLSVIAIGIIMGTIASFTLTRFLQNQVWGVSTHDPLTFSTVVSLLVAVGAAACLIPARRATRVDSMGRSAPRVRHSRKQKSPLLRVGFSGNHLTL